MSPAYDYVSHVETHWAEAILDFVEVSRKLREGAAQLWH